MASDGAGNTANGGFSVTVLGAPDQIVNLREYVKGTSLNSNLRTTLVTYLQKALTVPSTTASICSALGKAQTLLQTATIASLSTTQKTYLIGEITRIRNVIGCP